MKTALIFGVSGQDQLEALLQAHAPDEIYNLSGQSSVARSFDIPGETYDSVATATLNLLDAVRELHMPVTCYITTDERTVISYILRPLLQNIDTALRE